MRRRRGAWTEDEIKAALGFPNEVLFEYREARTADGAARGIDPHEGDTVRIVSGFNHTNGSILVALAAAFYEGLTLPDVRAASVPQSDIVGYCDRTR